MHTFIDNVHSVANATGMIAEGAQTRVLITRFAAFANNIGIDRPNAGDVVSYLDNHINQNIAVNGTPSSTQNPQ